MNVYQIVGNNIQRLRKRKKLNQLEFSKIINLSRTGVVNLEKGRSQPSIFRIWEIAEFFGVTLHDIIPDCPEEGKPIVVAKNKELPESLIAFLLSQGCELEEGTLKIKQVNLAQ